MRERRSATHEANPHWVLLLFGGAAVIACLIVVGGSRTRRLATMVDLARYVDGALGTK